MKLIEQVPIWDKGQVRQAGAISAKAFDVNLNNSCSFYYSLHEVIDGVVGNKLTEGNLYMGPEDYNLWEKDDFAWDWVAGQLSLVIIGDYIAPEPPSIVDQPLEQPIEE